MEIIGGRTESPTETVRPIRHVRSNYKSISTKLDESKDQENVNNSSIAKNKVDNTVKGEVAKTNSEIAKVNGSTSNINSSTPRRRKDPLANLHSNLSPKYIGYITPPDQLNNSIGERSRSLRRRENHNNNNFPNTSEDRDTEPDITFTPTTESTLGYIRRTPRIIDSPITPERSTKGKDFVSPIDKLLIKNRAAMENNSSLLADNNDWNLNDEGIVATFVNKNELQEMHSTINICNNFHKESEKSQNLNALRENCNENIYNKQPNVSISTEIKKLATDADSKDEQEKDDLNLASNESENILSNVQKEHKFDEPEAETKLDQHEYSPSEEFLKNDVAEVNLNIEESEILSKDTTKVEPIQNHEDEKKTVKPIEENFEDANKTSNCNSLSSKNSNAEPNKENLVKVELDSVENESNNEFTLGPSVIANSPSAISMDSAKGSSIINVGTWMPFSTGDLYWGQIYNYCYWPCMICPDPNGKIIETGEAGRAGDQSVLVHVRFFADNGRRNWVKRDNLIPYNGIESYQERIADVREKYGSKSARYKLLVPTKKKEHIWYEAVKEANIVAGELYTSRLEKFFEIFEKSKAFHRLEKQRRKSMYISINCKTTSDLESFYDSNENINNLSTGAAVKQKRERSISPYSPAYSPIKPISVKKRKISGYQEATTSTSSVAVAKDEKKLNNTDLNLSQANSFPSTRSNSLNDVAIFNGSEFKMFYGLMKDYVMEQNQNEKLEKSLVVAVRNIWALKQLSHRQMERKRRESPTDNDMPPTLAMVTSSPTGEESVKRLSSRLKSLMLRKSLMTQRTYESTPERSVTPKEVLKEAPSEEKVKKVINRPILEVIDDIFELDSKYLFKGMTREPVCKYCFKPGDNLKKCSKNCTFWLHSDCLYKDFNTKARRATKSYSSTKVNNETLNSSNNSSLVSLTEVGVLGHVTGDSKEASIDVACKECANNMPIKCLVCNSTQSKREDDPLVKCCMSQCERSFHPGCCKYWPQAKITISKSHIESFRCPSHVCHTCVSDDPKGKFQHLSNSKLTKCVKCPATFHTDSTCIPAGSQILTAAHIICPRHSSTKHDMTVNVNWCFICVKGGQVMCCETCPTAVHAHCLNIPIAANEGYICEECESGRMPLYGEIVWAKFKHFRWWPAIILPPTEIPKNIERKAHNPSDFVVRFFGTHDHGWISRRRVYLYLEGDSSEPPKTKSSLDLNYNKGVTEAKEVYQIIKAKKIKQRNSNESKEKLHPQPYVRIKANRAVPPVRLHIDMECVSKCECDAREENPCGPDTNCLNRVLYHECNPKVCPAGERCQNQMFESRISPRLDVVYMRERGFGLICREPIKAGSFIIEYVGEVINDDEFQARMQQKSRDRDENFYFLSVEKDYIIDAGPKGNLARFMNHSCDPNCETQKWNVNSLNRVGLFAIKDIPENTELTFNYHWDDLLGNEKKTCYCGAKNCAGQIGGKIKDMETIKVPTVVNRIAGSSKTKIKPIKRLLKNKLGSKVKVRVKKTITKKMPVSTAKLERLEPDVNSTSTIPIRKKESISNQKVSTSRHLVSPDVFS